MKSRALNNWFGTPATVWLSLFLAGPLLMVFLLSFCTRGTYGGIEYTLTFMNYAKAFQPLYLEIYLRSLTLAVMTTGLCLLIGFPMAWAISTSSSRQRSVLIFLLALPFLMNLVIRVYSVRLFVGFEGPIQELLRWTGTPHDPFSFTRNQFLVLYGMVTSYLPFMVFPLFASLEKFDFSQVEASYDLGASHWQTLTKVLIPGNRHGISNGCLLVFVPSMGEFVIPDLLGSAKNMLMGNLITEQFLKARDWPLGAALTVVFVTTLVLFAVLIIRWGGRYGKEAS
ncbi:MAG: ABC transporter permease [Pseudobdellovibrionaceae bacterium]